MVIDFDLQQSAAPRVMSTKLSLISKSHTLRCDAKQAEPRFSQFDDFISSVECFYLGDFLPQAFVKGTQPKYIESLDPEGIPVISTICINQLSIRQELCRYISQEDYDELEDERKPRKRDVLLTVDGGTSIGKPAYFDLEDEYAIDSHVAILRPISLDPRLLVYLLASPLGHIQFQRAESGASGQTGVTEDDIRRFRFPVIKKELIDSVVNKFDQERAAVGTLEAELKQRVEQAWVEFHKAIVANCRTH